MLISSSTGWLVEITICSGDLVSTSWSYSCRCYIHPRDGRVGDAVVSTIMSEKKVLGFKFTSEPVNLEFAYSPSFFPRSKDIHLRLIGVSKLAVGVKVNVNCLCV